METNKGNRIFKFIMLIILVIIITIIGTTIFMFNYFCNGEGIKYIVTSTNKTEDMDTVFASYKKVLEEKYLGEINDEDLRQGAIRGYIEGLNDPYTEYMDKDEYEELKTVTTGDYVGIGIYMIQNIRDNTIVIASPIKNSPAEEAGIQPGDVIVKVDDVEYTGEQTSIAANKIKGIEGTKVKLELLRNGETINLELTRRNVELVQMESKMLENNIGYIKVGGFDTGCIEEFENHYNELKDKNATSLIIDLRDNGGGLVDECLGMLNFIVEKGDTTLITVDKDGKRNVSKSKGNVIVNVPIVVLVNENTASASEIYAGALRDNNIGTIIGTTTFGKGVIQEVIPLKDGAALKVTTREYLTPKENKINNIGITPDIEVEESEDLTVDLVLQRAIQELTK